MLGIDNEISKSGDFMKPKTKTMDQGELFRSRLDQILNRRHPLFMLAGEIDWTVFEQAFGPLYVENVGRPGTPIRLLVGLHYLKHAFNESDESVVARLLAELLARAERIHAQKRQDTNKLYSLHAPEVTCIAKGKAHKKYEFGCKVSLVTTSKDNWIIGTQALHHNPFDGHTLKGALEQATRLTGWRPGHAYCDGGYKGTPKILEGTAIHLPDRRKWKKPSEWRWFKRRSAIEPVIGHTKKDHRMNRNYLKGVAGDMINALLAACGFNIRKLLRVFFWLLFKELFLAWQTVRKSIGITLLRTT